LAGTNWLMPRDGFSQKIFGVPGAATLLREGPGERASAAQSVALRSARG